MMVSCFTNPDLVQRMVGEGCVQGGGPVDALQAGEYPWDPEPALGDQGQEEDGCCHLCSPTV